MWINLDPFIFQYFGALTWMKCKDFLPLNYFLTFILSICYWIGSYGWLFTICLYLHINTMEFLFFYFLFSTVDFFFQQHGITITTVLVSNLKRRNKLIKFGFEFGVEDEKGNSFFSSHIKYFIFLSFHSSKSLLLFFFSSFTSSVF